MMFQTRAPNIKIKTREELDGMRVACRLASKCLSFLIEQVKPGITTQDIDDLVVQFCKQHGARSATLGYRGFTKSLCTSVNEGICHGIPDPKTILRSGDIVGIDVTLIVDGFFGDNAATVPVGEAPPNARRLLAATLEGLRRGIASVSPHGRLGDIGHAIQSYIEPLGLSVVRDFVGHGIGRAFHEEPQVPHHGRPNRGSKLRPGMVFTIEPMINEGDYRTRVLGDGWTAVTTDGKLSAQFEHTIAVTPQGVEVLTVQNDTGDWEAPGRAVIDPAP
jgi:methionyl aminopeptidase